MSEEQKAFESWAAGNHYDMRCHPLHLIEEYEDDVLYEITEASIEVLCLMALADAFGFEYGEFV